MDADGKDIRVQSDGHLIETIDGVLDVYDIDVNGYIEYSEFRISEKKYKS